MSKAIKIYRKFGDNIKADYESGDSVEDLCKPEKYEGYVGCSYNTMMVILGMLGFPSTEYFQPQIEAKLKYLEEDQKRRTAVSA